MGASRLAAELEAEYRSSWPGHQEAAELAATIGKEAETWQRESASASVQIGRAAAAVARRTGDMEAEARLSAETVRPSIAAKLSAYAEAQRDGRPYVNPIPPDTSATIESRPVYDANPTTTIR